MHFQKENIRINCILPGIVATKIIPPEMIAAVSPEWSVYATSSSSPSKWPPRNHKEGTLILTCGPV